VLWKQALLLIAATGLGTGAPVVIGNLRHVDAAGLPDHMAEINDPSIQVWFGTDGGALIYYSREADGTLRFWNRPGATPDHAFQALPVTPEVRREWERQEAAKAEREKQRQAQNAQAEGVRQQATESQALRDQLRQLQQQATEQRNRELAEQEAQRHQAEEAQLKAQVDAMRVEVEALQTQAANARSGESEPSATPEPLTNNLRVQDASTGSADDTQTVTSSQSQGPLNLGDPPRIETMNFEKPQPTAATFPPESAPSYNLVYRLWPALWLNCNVHGRPCTVWSDVPFEIFPNDPSMAHRWVRAGERFRFPLLQGIGPTTLHARPGGGTGTIYIRFDD
jgi:hypothetical protein